MKRILALAILGLAMSATASDTVSFESEDAMRLLGLQFRALRNVPDLTVEMHGDYVDEDEHTILDEYWTLTWPDGRSVFARTNDRIVTGIDIRNENIQIDRGIRVGDTLSRVKAAFPEAEFVTGSTTMLSESLTLYADYGNIAFVFYDDKIRDGLDEGKTYRFDDPKVEGVKLKRIHFQDGNKFACGEQYPCPHFPARYARD